MNRKKTVSMAVAALMSIGILAGCGNQADDKESITILRGQFAEIDILAEMAGMLIEEKTDLEVDFHDSMNTVAAGNAMENDEIDLYISYDGTLLTTLLGHDPSDVPEGDDLYTWTIEKGIEERGLMLTSKFGFENTYALGVKSDYAEENGIETIRDLKAKSSELIFGAEHEFFDEEGTMRFNPFNEHYGMEWKDGISLDIGLKYAAIDNENIDVTMVYSTDGLNQKSDLKILEDDLKFFPQYYGAFLHRDTLFEEFEESAPDLEEILLSLEGQISNEEMIAMNYQVDAEGAEPSDVAKKFLEDKGLLN